MSLDEYKKYFEILELNPEASLSDVRISYRRLKELYSSDSIVISPLADEFPESSRLEILDQIEESYKKLISFFDQEKGGGIDRSEKPLSKDRDLENYVAGISAFSGAVLKGIREKAGVELYEIALATKIRIRYLENIELEKFDALPPEVYLRGFVVDYARYLSLDYKKVADDYMEIYKKWRNSGGGSS